MFYSFLSRFVGPVEPCFGLRRFLHLLYHLITQANIVIDWLGVTGIMSLMCNRLCVSQSAYRKKGFTRRNQMESEAAFLPAATQVKLPIATYDRPDRYCSGFAISGGPKAR